MTFLKNIIIDDKQLNFIDDFNINENICINVLTRNMKTNKLTAYFPIYKANTTKLVGKISFCLFL